MKKPHHSGTYQVVGERIRASAKANPRAICWRDGLTLDQHPAHADGSRPYWTAGHTVAGYRDAPGWYAVTQRPPSGPWLAAEASTCNYSAGARHTNKLRANPHSETWF